MRVDADTALDRWRAGHEAAKYAVDVTYEVLTGHLQQAERADGGYPPASVFYSRTMTDPGPLLADLAGIGWDVIGMSPSDRKVVMEHPALVASGRLLQLAVFPAVIEGHVAAVVNSDLRLRVRMAVGMVHEEDLVSLL